jgi:hypothetical protein
MVRDLLDSCDEGLDQTTKKFIQDKINEVNTGKVISTEGLRRRLLKKGEEKNKDDNTKGGMG